MNLNTEVSTQEVMQCMLNAHSLNYILWLTLKTYGCEDAEYLADKWTKVVDGDE